MFKYLYSSLVESSSSIGDTVTSFECGLDMRVVLPTLNKNKRSFRGSALSPDLSLNLT